ncbi:MAG: prepilin-type N-terminal cleavage/methylation domain-containing protein [Polyangiaceae bacterium]|nr:prepilin-type N-terminal cleavage/methylation domain-containing protein [Polyangiaceae bacterium]
MKRKKQRAGFTLLEVMIAVGLMTVGALAIMAMQQAATRGNIEARQIGTATDITSRWVERLRREAIGWNQTGETVPAAAGTLAAINGAPNTWFRAPAATFAGDVGPAFDWMGLPLANPAGQAISYCTFVRLRWVSTGSSMRADVLTWWHRRGAGGDPAISDLSLFANCGEGVEANVIANLGSSTTVLRSVSASTLLRWTP